MATLGNIRKHGVLLICIVGFAMLAFIVGDFLTSSTSFFRGQQTTVGEIEGIKVDYTDYQKRIDQLTEVYKMENQTSDLNEDATNAVRNQAWQMYVYDYTLAAQAKKIGMMVTKEELNRQCFGKDNKPASQIITSRLGSGQNALLNYNYAFNQATEEDLQGQNGEQIAQFKNYWLYLENIVRISRLQEKYISLLTECVSANSLDAKYAFQAGLTSVDVAYAMKPFYAVPDESVKVSNADLKALYKKNKEMYKQKPNRSIKYIVFELKPSAQDDQEAKAQMEALQEEFYTTSDVASVVNANSDITFDGRDYSEKTIPAEYKDWAFSANVGDHTDLQLLNGYYTMARIVKTGYSLPDSIKVKFIADPKDTTQKDQEIGWLTAETVNKDFADKAFACKAGQRFTLPMGAQEQTFEVEETSKPVRKVQVAILAREVIVSDRTKAYVYNEAMQYIINNNNTEKFEANADTLGYEVHTCNGLEAITPKVDNLPSSREIVRWAFTAKEGQVSEEAYQCGDNYVIAALSGVSDAEYKSLDEVANILRFEATNNKKAEAIKEELAGVKTLEEAAKKLDSEIKLAEGVTLASYIFGEAGAEPAVIGTAMRLKEGELSEPVQGQAGVYVIKGGKKTTTEAEFNANALIQQLNQRTAYSLPYQAMSLIEDKANIKDNRAKFQ